MVEVTLEKFVNVMNLAMHAVGNLEKTPVEIFFTKSKDGVKYSISNTGIVSEELRSGMNQYEGVEDFFEFLTYFKRTEESKQGDDLLLVYEKLLRVAWEWKEMKKILDFQDIEVSLSWPYSE